jgi:hypothetical protein
LRRCTRRYSSQRDEFYHANHTRKPRLTTFWLATQS